MILAAAQSKLWFNWFDVALVLILAFGIWRGRKNGMSKEFLPASTWLTIVIAGGLGNDPLGTFFIQSNLIKPLFGRHFNERTAADISAYLIIAVVVWLIFYVLKKYLKAKLEGSNAFGAMEYYLGMISGALRYACYTVFALAMINAPYYSSDEIAAKVAYNNRWYGGGMQGYSGNFIPTLDELQVVVFKDSLFGPTLKTYLSPLLIDSVSHNKIKAPVVEIK